MKRCFRNLTVHLWLLPLMVAFWSIALIPMKTLADEYTEFTNAKNAFEAGEYEAAINRFNELLKSGLQNPSLVLEVHKLLGISYLFTKNRDAAEKHFIKLLTQLPNYTLDPLLYPIEVVDFFTEIKRQNQKRLDQLARVQAQQEERRRAEEERRRKAEIEKLRRNVYLERERKQHSRLVAVMPFGAGQFQNKHKVKGALFLSSELLLIGTAITSYFLHAGLRKRAAKSFDNPEDRENHELREKVYRITNHASLGTLAAVMAAGIVDSLYFFQPETVEWKTIKEKDVPPKMRPGSKKSKVALLVILGDSLFSAGIAGSF